MNLSQNLLQHIEYLMLSNSGRKEKLSLSAVVSGGDISSAYKIDGMDNHYFIKINNAKTFPEMFRIEADGLKELGNFAPKVVLEGVFEDRQFLLLEWIDPVTNNMTGQANLGKLLADLHQKTTAQFGLKYDNYIGKLPQINTQNNSWTEFFIQNRLLYQLKHARDNGLIDRGISQRFEQLFNRLPQLFPEEPPSLIHGDLWSGNYIISHNAKPFLIDPAIYYGHREMDIAMTKLFGGFSIDFYTSYHEHFPLQPGWQSRVHLWNIYPLLVHINLFGSSYLPRLKENLAKFV